MLIKLILHHFTKTATSAAQCQNVVYYLEPQHAAEPMQSPWLVGMLMVGMADGSRFWGPVNGILCIFSTYLGRLARAVPSNLRISENLQRSKMHVAFSTPVLHERERYIPGLLKL